MTPSFVRSDDDRVIAGVCGGIAERFSVNPWLVRLVFLFTLPVAGYVYAALWLVLPSPTEPPGSNRFWM